jgi:hypothetical protein
MPPFFPCCPFVFRFRCSGDEHHGSGEACGGVDVTTRYGNWNGYKMATIWVLLGAAGMHRDAREASWECCGDAVVVSQLRSLLLLGAKQGQDVYLAGQLLPSFLRHQAQLATTHVARMIVACHGRMNPNAELIVCFN